MIHNTSLSIKVRGQILKVSCQVLATCAAICGEEMAQDVSLLCKVYWWVGGEAVLGRTAKDTQKELVITLCNIISFSNDCSALPVLLDSLTHSNSLSTLKSALDALD